MTKSIVLTVCAECRVHPNEFFGSGRDRRLVSARRKAIFRLQNAGFSMAGIARLMRRNYSTIQYWMNPEYREQKSVYYAAKRLAEKRAAA